MNSKQPTPKPEAPQPEIYTLSELECGIWAGIKIGLGTGFLLGGTFVIWLVALLR